MPNWNEINENYLAHFGIPGMKWGIRRYQNRDGSLTAKGYARLEKKRDYVEYEANTNSAKYIEKHQKKIEKQVMKEHNLKTTNSKKFKEEYDKKIDEIYDKNYNKSVNSLMKQTVNRNKTIALLGVAGAITVGVLIKKYVNAKRENDDDNALAHYGIKDMHWGIRRFQNEDGTLTYEGRQRYYANASAEAKAYGAASKGFKDAANAINTGSDKRTYPNHYEELSDQELNSRIQRIEKERKYSDLVGDTKIQKPANYYVKETLQTVGSVLGIAASAITVGMLIHKVSGTRSGADNKPKENE